jgi:hypothetical protein
MRPHRAVRKSPLSEGKSGAPKRRRTGSARCARTLRRRMASKDGMRVFGAPVTEAHADLLTILRVMYTAKVRRGRLRIGRQGGQWEKVMGRGILLWMLGVPTIILFLAMCQHSSGKHLIWEPSERGPATPANESSKSALSWPTIIAGAVAATSTSVLLLALGSGLGLISASPWPGSGAFAGTLTALAAIWFIAVQWIASGLGGYLTGRLRTKWAGTHTHEVFFRDTAHGFVTWALATVVLGYCDCLRRVLNGRHGSTCGRNARLRRCTRRCEHSATHPPSADMTSICCFARLSLIRMHPQPTCARKRRASSRRA